LRKNLRWRVHISVIAHENACLHMNAIRWRSSFRSVLRSSDCGWLFITLYTYFVTSILNAKRRL
jgi:hypothetical protein